MTAVRGPSFSSSCAWVSAPSVVPLRTWVIFATSSSPAGNGCPSEATQIWWRCASSCQVSSYGDAISPGALHGLKVVAVAVVAQAVWGMARNLCTDLPRVTITTIAACVVLLVPFTWGQVGTIAAAGIAGLLLFRPMSTAPSGWIGGTVCLLWIFAPSFLLVVGALPFWERRWAGSMPR